jgi:hypothetical protein
MTLETVTPADLPRVLRHHGTASHRRRTSSRSHLEGLDTVKIGPWFAKMRTKHRAGQLDAEHERLVAAFFDSDWTAEDPVPAFA